MKNSNAIFTIVSLNYMHYALNVRRSFLEHNTGYDFVIFLMDKCTSDEASSLLEKYKGDGVQILSFEEPKKSLSDYPIEDMLSRYSVVEMNTAIKPFCIEYLFKKKYNKVIYIDPDIQFYAPITELDQILDKYDIVLTPHMMSPYPDDGLDQSCQTINQAGIYNCGFFAAKNTQNSLKCIKFWQWALKDKAYVDTTSGLFTDQIWANWFPALYENVYILKNYGYNMAYWNLHERTLSQKNGIYYANDDPLIFYHFSGLNRNNLNPISKYQTRYTLDQREKCLTYLFKDYIQSVNKFDAEIFSTVPYFVKPTMQTKNFKIKRKYLWGFYKTIKTEKRLKIYILGIKIFSLKIKKGTKK